MCGSFTKIQKRIDLVTMELKEINKELDKLREIVKWKDESKVSLADKPEVIIFDNNELNILNYAEEFPENWKRICDALNKEKEDKK